MLVTSSINHIARRKLGIAFLEYAVCDMIFKLASGPNSNGWCRMSRSQMAEQVDLSKRGLIYMIDRLVDVGVVEKNEDGNLRTTQLWYDTAVWAEGQKESYFNELITQKEGNTGAKTASDSGAKIAPVSVQKLHRIGAKSAPYTSNTSSNTENIQAGAKNFLEFPEELHPEPEHTPEEESPPGSAAPPLSDGDVEDTNVPNTYTLEDFKRDYQTTSNSAKLEANWLKLSREEKEKIRQIVPRYIEYNPDPAYRKSPENFVDLRHRHWESEIIDRRQKTQTATQTASNGKRNSPAKTDLLTRKRELAEKHLAILEAKGLVKDGRVLTNHPT